MDDDVRAFSGCPVHALPAPRVLATSSNPYAPFTTGAEAGLERVEDVRSVTQRRGRLRPGQKLEPVAGRVERVEPAGARQPVVPADLRARRLQPRSEGGQPSRGELQRGGGLHPPSEP